MAKYKFIQTDEVHPELDEVEQDLADLHPNDGCHDPLSHLCDACLDADPHDCWCLRHEEEPDETRNPRPLNERGSRDCHCRCHFVFEQCQMVQARADNAGRSMYRLENEENELSMVIPASVYDKFMDLDEDKLDEIIGHILEQATQIPQEET